MKNASLIAVGAGIKFMSHLTTEAKAYIQNSDKVLYLVNDAVMNDWIKKTNGNSVSLQNFYQPDQNREHCYNAITEYILEELRKIQHVCVVLYGHPTIFAKPALEAIIKAKKEGFYAEILPGISSEACLFADLLINPGSAGCQSFESTDLLIKKRNIDTASHVLLWQIGMIGSISYPAKASSQAINLLIEHLNLFYPLDQEVTLYEASQFPHMKPRIEKALLRELVPDSLTVATTLYIPPIKKLFSDKRILNALGIINSNG